MTRATALASFLRDQGLADATRIELQGDSSSRRYERLVRRSERWILMDDPTPDHVSFRAFQSIAAHLAQKGLSAPAIYAADNGHGFMLLEDLGDAVYAREIEKDPKQETELYLAAIDLFNPLQKGSIPAGIPIYGPPEMTQAAALAFQAYRADGMPEQPEKTTAALAILYNLLAQEEHKPALSLRDYHAENLIWLADRKEHARVGLLDFQDAVATHPLYDLASLTRDARRDVPQDLAHQCIERHAANTNQTFETVSRSTALIAVQRNLRILGVFARLSRSFGKTQYIDLIPRVWRMLQQDLNTPLLHPFRDALLPLLPSPSPNLLSELKRPCQN